MRSVLGVHWEDWCLSWNSNTLATSWKELTHWKRPWCWEGLGAGGEGDDRGLDGWMASLTNGCGFGWTPGVGDGQGGLACCDSWGHKESDTTEWLIWTEHLLTDQRYQATSLTCFPYSSFYNYFNIPISPSLVLAFYIIFHLTKFYHSYGIQFKAHLLWEHFPLRHRKIFCVISYNKDNCQ